MAGHALVALKHSPGAEPNRRAFEGWRAEIGIPELNAIVRYVRRPFGVTKLAQYFTELAWPADEAIALAMIVSRLAELNYERRRTA